jgi:hypothetical protein
MVCDRLGDTQEEAGRIGVALWKMHGSVVFHVVFFVAMQMSPAFRSLRDRRCCVDGGRATDIGSLRDQNARGRFGARHAVDDPGDAGR